MYKNFLKKQTMDRKYIQCNYCFKDIEVPPKARVVSCMSCNRENRISGGRTSPQSSNSLGRSWRGSRPSHGSSMESSRIMRNPSASESWQNKKAVLCGVSYKGMKFKLKGTVNDVNNMKDFLTRTFHFPEQRMRILTEANPDKDLIPTKENIEKALKWLVEGCQSGDSLVFFFSGHGLRQPEFEGDEKDGYDETLCPVDFNTQGMIIDNDINSIIVKPLPEGVKLHAIIDSCHSGTILDLHHIYNREKEKWDEDEPPSKRPPKGTKGGLAVCFSACDDHQRAADTSAFSEKNKKMFSRRAMSGALTTLFINAIKNNPNITYAGVLDSIYDGIYQSNVHGRCFRSSLKTLFNNRLLQEPQLSSSEKFDVNMKFEL